MTEAAGTPPQGSLPPWRARLAAALASTAEIADTGAWIALLNGATTSAIVAKAVAATCRTAAKLV